MDRCEGPPVRALIFGLPLVALLGCTRQPIKPKEPQPFVFRSLNLRQQDGQGRPAWELTSPQARYDLQRRIARATDPRGVIYVGGKPRYKVEATSGLVINDGEVIQLEGKVRILVLGPRGSVISGDRVRWTPGRQLMEIDRRPVLTERQSRLSATTARFLLDKDKLELRGKTRVQQPELDLRASRADWQANTGALVAAGPVKGSGGPPLRRALSRRSRDRRCRGTPARKWWICSRRCASRTPPARPCLTPSAPAGMPRTRSSAPLSPSPAWSIS